MGKSTSVRFLAKHAKRHLVEIDLEKSPQLDAVFASFDVPNILDALQSLPRGSRLQPDSILFLDEIHATPHAIPALRYLHEERPDLPVVAAGSLLEFALAEHAFSMPVGRIKFLNLGPMSFVEFLLAHEENVLAALRRNGRQNFQIGIS